MTLYNDQVYIMWLVLAMYNFAKDRMFLGTVLFSIATGVKAGGILLIPAILGLA